LFLEFTGELRIIALRRKKGGSETCSTNPLRPREWLGHSTIATTHKRNKKDSEILSSSHTPKLELILSSSEQSVKARASTIENNRIPKLPHQLRPEDDVGV
jgi:hypothetical protein